MATEKAETAESALNQLVNQFADKMAFLRELIQNALDAGTDRIDVEVGWDTGGANAPDGNGRRRGLVEIIDYGEGMDRSIIETRLTRLFSSTKDDDFTKIGRFGIGFVSVFAIEPDAVVVDTSRAGERWRVLFGPDRTYELLRPDDPMEGTHIRIYKQFTAGELAEFRARAKQVVTFWCRHADAEILVYGDDITGPLEVEGQCIVRHEEEGTQVIVALGPQFAGFYNRGLTLYETNTSYFSHVSFKISSRHLEHTLSRDNVVKDANFHKAMGIVQRLVERDVPLEWLSQVSAALRVGDAKRTAILWSRGAGALFAGIPREPATKGGGNPREIPLLLSVSGDLLSADDLHRAHKKERLYAASTRSLITDRLADNGAVVVNEQQQGVTAIVAKLVPVRLHDPHKLYVLSTAPKADTDWSPLERAVELVLKQAGLGATKVHVRDVHTAGATRVYVAQDELDELTERKNTNDWRRGSLLRRRPCLVLNAQSTVIWEAGKVAHDAPELAAFYVARHLFDHTELDAILDEKLAVAALEVRCRRA